MSVPTFVVGTGRCGSTMLSTMLREHPKVLSLSEFFSFLGDGGYNTAAFGRDPIDGRGFWSIVGKPTRYYDFFFRHGLQVPEFLYPREDRHSRFSPQTGIPAILLTTLPHLTSQHDALFEELSEEIPEWPTAAIAEHYRHLFEWLTQRFGKRQWIERSGTFVFFADVLRMFPDAQFLHIVRDGRDAALSMQRHDLWRLGMTWIRIGEYLGVNPVIDQDRTNIDRVPENLKRYLPERADVEAFRDIELPLSACGAFWVQQIASGLKLLSTLPADRLLTLRYEDFFIDPKRQLDALTAFLGEEFVDENWSARCAATVRKPRSTWRDLSEEEVRALTEACRPGFELLREARVKYDT